MYRQNVNEAGLKFFFSSSSLLCKNTRSGAIISIIYQEVTCSTWNQKLANTLRILQLVDTTLPTLHCLLERQLKWRVDSTNQRNRWWPTWFLNAWWNPVQPHDVEKYKTSTNLRDSPPRTSGQTSNGFQDEFYYNRSIKHYKGCIQVPFWPGDIKNKPEIRIKLETDESWIFNTTT